jgi:hypothetical protein
VPQKRKPDSHANPKLAHWMRELRKSSAAQPHVAKPYKGTRRQRERQALRDQGRDIQ